MILQGKFLLAAVLVGTAAASADLADGNRQGEKTDNRKLYDGGFDPNDPLTWGDAFGHTYGDYGGGGEPSTNDYYEPSTNDYYEPSTNDYYEKEEKEYSTTTYHIKPKKHGKSSKSRKEDKVIHFYPKDNDYHGDWNKETHKPTNKPTNKPTRKPSKKPTKSPTWQPSWKPTRKVRRPCILILLLYYCPLFRRQSSNSPTLSPFSFHNTMIFPAYKKANS